MRQLLTVAFALSLMAGGLGSTGCSNKGVELDMSKTVPYNPETDSKEKMIGGGGNTKGIKGKGGAAPQK